MRDSKTIWIWGAIFVFVVLSRLLYLGYKPPMHDECMFFFYSYELSKNLNYTYFPILHGPLMIHLSALIYALLGASEFTIRLPVSLLGIGIFGWLWGMRKYFGDRAFAVMALLFVFSPMVMFYSRFWRHDVPLEFAFLGALYFFLKFVDEQKGWAFFGSIIFCALAFCIKENSLFFFFTVLMFFVIHFFVFSINHEFGSRNVISRFYNLIRKNKYYFFSGVLLSVVIYILLFTTMFKNPKGFFEIYRDVFSYWWGQHNLHRISGEFHYHFSILLIYEFLPVGIVLGGMVFSFIRGRKKLSYLLGLWISFTLIFLSFFLSGWAEFNTAWFAKYLHISSPIHIWLIISIFYFGLLQTVRYILKQETFFAFLLFWTWTSLLLYSYAGEKVPWLGIHIMVPLLLTAGLYIKKLFHDPFYLRHKKALAGIFIILFSATVFNTMRVNFIQPANIAERMVYAHVSMEIKDAVRKIEQVAARLKTYQSTEIHVENGLLIHWQLRWYFRDYQNLREVTGAESFSAPICFVKWDHLNPHFPPSLLSNNIRENYLCGKIKMATWWQAPGLNLNLMFKIWKIFIPDDPAAKKEAEDSLKEWAKPFNYFLFRQTFDAYNSKFPSVSSVDCGFCVRKERL